jgi:hypothetical protein
MAEGPQDTGMNRGILWGCITPVAIVLLIAGGWLFYNTYYYTSGYKEAPGLPEAMAAVRANPAAKRMLGDNIQISQMELNMPSNAKQNGRRIFYKVHVKGTKGEGEVQTSVLLDASGTKITSLKLMGADDTPYNLLAGP